MLIEQASIRDSSESRTSVPYIRLFKMNPVAPLPRSSGRERRVAETRR